jgi:ketosteroid isomerase-like protein
MRNFSLIFLVAVSVILFTFAAADCKDFKDSVKEQNKAFSDAVSRHDAIALAALYDDDGQVLAPNHEVVKGRDAIQDLFKSMLTPSISAITLDTQDTEKEDDLGVETGTYEVKGEHDATLDKGKYIVVWKKHGGKWQIYRDIWNSSLPPAGPVPAEQ